ncbi:MAG: hypothetical protein GX660_17350 [Clostridiaceae bacterium]|nr:hypothetical protein [Clostridiaceae bacterium]
MTKSILDISLWILFRDASKKVTITDHPDISKECLEALVNNKLTTIESIKKVISNNSMEAFSSVPENYKGMVEKFTKPVLSIVNTSQQTLQNSIPETIFQGHTYDYTKINTGIANSLTMPIAVPETIFQGHLTTNITPGIAESWTMPVPNDSTDGAFLANVVQYGDTVILAFFGALICFGIYKLIKWLRNRKKEEIINLNLFKIQNKFNEGNIFIKSLSNKLTENEEQKINKMYNTIEKAKPLTKELATYVMESFEKKDTEKSFLKRKSYQILGFIAGLSIILIFCFNGKKIV